MTKVSSKVKAKSAPSKGKATKAKAVKAKPVAKSAKSKESVKTKPAKSTVSALKKVAHRILDKASETLAIAERKIEKISAAPVAAQKAPKARGTEKAQARESAMIRANKEALESAANEADGKKRGRKAKTEDVGPEESLSKLGKKWAGLYKKSDEENTPAYNMRGVFEEKSPIQHKVLGWGYILSNKNDRLEVLFKDGVRFLISNYKA